MLEHAQKKADFSFEARQRCEQREQNAVALVRRCSCVKKIGSARGFLVASGGHAAKLNHDEACPAPVRVAMRARRHTNGTKGMHLIRVNEAPCKIRT